MFMSKKECSYFYCLILFRLSCIQLKLNKDIVVYNIYNQAVVIIILNRVTLLINSLKVSLFIIFALISYPTVYWNDTGVPIEISSRSSARQTVGLTVSCEELVWLQPHIWTITDQL